MTYEIYTGADGTPQAREVKSDEVSKLGILVKLNDDDFVIVTKDFIDKAGEKLKAKQNERF